MGCTDPIQSNRCDFSSLDLSTTMSSSLDLSTTILWQSLSKDVYTYGKLEGSKSGPAPILEISEDPESEPLLQKEGNTKKKKKGMTFIY